MWMGTERWRRKEEGSRETEGGKEGGVEEIQFFVPLVPAAVMSYGMKA